MSLYINMYYIIYALFWWNISSKTQNTIIVFFIFIVYHFIICFHCNVNPFHTYIFRTNINKTIDFAFIPSVWYILITNETISLHSHHFFLLTFWIAVTFFPIFTIICFHLKTRHLPYISNSNYIKLCQHL